VGFGDAETLAAVGVRQRPVGLDALDDCFIQQVQVPVEAFVKAGEGFGTSQIC